MKNPSIKEKTLAFCRAQNLLPPGCRVLCALSGGADSMALLSLLEELAGELALRVTAAHYNHRLRGEESLRDAAFAADWCKSRGIPLRLGEGDVAGEARRRRQGVEETARAMRYAFLEETANILGADYIATAHNADDNAETVLLHLLRGSGLDGLCGIPPRRGRLIRPLLAVTREEIEAYLQARGIPHVEDASNADPRFARNRLRREVLPVLRDLNPAFVPRLTANLEHLRAHRDYLDAQAQALIRDAQPRQGGLALPAGVLAQAPRTLALRGVKLLLARMGRHQVSAVHLEAVLRLAESQDPSAWIPLPQGLEARREYELLVLSPACAPPPAPLVLEGCGRWDWGDWILTIAAQGEGWRFGDLAFPLTLRSRTPGDRLSLPGRGSKSLKKWLIGEKIPQKQRDILPVLADARGILAVGGLGPNAPRLDPQGPWRLRLEHRKEERKT